MGIKLGGYVCDNCSVFSKYTGIRSGIELLEEFENNDNIKNIEDLNSHMIFHQNEGWVYYDIIPLDEEWFMWKRGESKCYCSDCDRLIKLKKILTKF